MPASVLRSQRGQTTGEQCKYCVVQSVELGCMDGRGQQKLEHLFEAHGRIQQDHL